MSSRSVRADTLTHRLPPDLAPKLAASLEDWQSAAKVRRLWERDASLWTGSGESNWLGWLDVVKEDAFDLPIPGQKYTFGVVKAAQARGDFQVLARRGRRALRVHFAKGVRNGLAALQLAVPPPKP